MCTTCAFETLLMAALYAGAIVWLMGAISKLISLRASLLHIESGIAARSFDDIYIIYVWFILRFVPFYNQNEEPTTNGQIIMFVIVFHGILIFVCKAADVLAFRG